ncbi:MAG: hypothetical protein HC915_00890 [Anaerolineae bacterium]|nr:hypothetical protein [Anaerolineae bacterium]
MQHQLNALYQPIKQGLATGALLGGLLVFLILIGIPSQESEQLAAATLPLFAALALFFGWRLARGYTQDWLALTINVLAAAVLTNFLLMSFLGIINQMHADNVDVVGDYFARMSTYPMQVLSGVPREELHPNPPRDPITREYPPNTELRTNPFQLFTRAEYAFFSVAGVHLGGF